MTAATRYSEGIFDHVSPGQAVQSSCVPFSGTPRLTFTKHRKRCYVHDVRSKLKATTHPQKERHHYNSPCLFWVPTQGHATGVLRVGLAGWYRKKVTMYCITFYLR
jgi:hypothetical protein